MKVSSACFLALLISLALPYPALALRPTEVGDNAGLEEEIRGALSRIPSAPPAAPSTRAGLEERQRPTSGLEERATQQGFLDQLGISTPASPLPRRLSRREVLRMAGRGLFGLLGSNLLTACAGLTPEQAAQPKPIGTFASLGETVHGNGKQLGLDVGDPRDLLRLPLVFPLAEKAGFDGIWFSGDRFLQLTPEEQQAIFTQASQAGIRTIGFTDGDRSQLSSFKAGPLRIAFAAKVNADFSSAEELWIRKEGMMVVVVERISREVDIEMTSRIAGHQAKKGGVSFHIAVPAKIFASMEEEIALALERAYLFMLPEERANLLGFIVQTESPLSAQRILLESMPAQPAPQFGARVIRSSPMEITLELDLPPEMIEEGWVAVPFVKTGSRWTPTSWPDQPTFYPIRVNGRVTVKASKAIPFLGGSTEERAVVFFPRSQADRAVQAYKGRDPLAAMQLSFRVVVIEKDRRAREASFSEIIQELRNSGLEEGWWNRFMWKVGMSELLAAGALAVFPVDSQKPELLQNPAAGQNPPVTRVVPLASARDFSGLAAGAARNVEVEAPERTARSELAEMGVSVPVEEIGAVETSEETLVEEKEEIASPPVSIGLREAKQIVGGRNDDGRQMDEPAPSEVTTPAPEGSVPTVEAQVEARAEQFFALLEQLQEKASNVDAPDRPLKRFLQDYGKKQWRFLSEEEKESIANRLAQMNLTERAEWERTAEVGGFDPGEIRIFLEELNGKPYDGMYAQFRDGRLVQVPWSLVIAVLLKETTNLDAKAEVRNDGIGLSGVNRTTLRWLWPLLQRYELVPVKLTPKQWAQVLGISEPELLRRLLRDDPTFNVQVGILYLRETLVEVQQTETPIEFASFGYNRGPAYNRKVLKAAGEDRVLLRFEGVSAYYGRYLSGKPLKIGLDYARTVSTTARLLRLMTELPAMSGDTQGPVGFLRQPDIRSVLSLLARGDRVVDLMEYFPNLSEQLAQAGYTKALLVPTETFPGTIQEPILNGLFVMPKWRSFMEENFPVGPETRYRLVNRLDQSQLVAGDGEFLLSVDRILFLSRPSLQVDLSTIRSVTPAFLAHLELQDLLRPGKTIVVGLIVQGDFGEALVVFA